MIESRLPFAGLSAVLLLMPLIAGGCANAPRASADQTMLAVAEPKLPEGARFNPVVKDIEG